jgi:hypothetical protein
MSHPAFAVATLNPATTLILRADGTGIEGSAVFEWWAADPEGKPDPHEVAAKLRSIADAIEVQGRWDAFES